MRLKQNVSDLDSEMMELNRKISGSKTLATTDATHGISVLDMLLRFIILVIILLLVG